MGTKNKPPKFTHYWELILLESVAFVHVKRQCTADLFAGRVMDI